MHAARDLDSERAGREGLILLIGSVALIAAVVVASTAVGGGAAGVGLSCLLVLVFAAGAAVGIDRWLSEHRKLRRIREVHHIMNMQLHRVLIELARYAKHDPGCLANKRLFEPEAPCTCGMEDTVQRFFRLLDDEHEERVAPLVETMLEIGESRRRLGW